MDMCYVAPREDLLTSTTVTLEIPNEPPSGEERKRKFEGIISRRR